MTRQLLILHPNITSTCGCGQGARGCHPCSGVEEGLRSWKQQGLGKGTWWGNSERCCWAGDPLSPYAARDPPPTVTPCGLGSHTHATQGLWCPCPKEQWPGSGLC